LDKTVFAFASEADWLVDAVLSDSAAIQVRISAFVDQNELAFRSVSFVVLIAGAVVASKRVYAGRVFVASVVVFIGTLVDVFANGSVTFKAVVASAGESTIVISALSVGIACSSDKTLVYVFTELAIAAESFFAFALIAAFRV